ncbi:PadR family transcriptional regulator [Haloechinothrix sp. YIM 98757]|uniref:PadR family transcriptional regulator n=2 Tax=Haloechinothrix aidingensis TaxID=2752311 RepID=A0A838ABE8_9PSEU|nr:PadR family transcriptional regulator [Haloechinothrix aidingensis]MBA0126570.1 PadR family transcriptional regulator [Haloechinothrix aidingensis]
MLSYADELSGYDIKKWADWSLQFFYWSPSYSQIYGELKRLERLGYAHSRTVLGDDGLRGKRMYAITQEGLHAASQWVNHAPVEAPVLKHSVILRAWLGHIAEPARLREVLQEHVDYAERMRQFAQTDADGAAANPAWAYPTAVLRWCTRYYEAERDFAKALLADIEALAEQPPARGASPAPAVSSTRGTTRPSGTGRRKPRG